MLTRKKKRKIKAKKRNNRRNMSKGTTEETCPKREDESIWKPERVN